MARVAIPGIEGGRLTSRESTYTPNFAAGSFVSFARVPPAPTGADPTFDGLRFEGEARFESSRLALAKPGDGLSFRVREGARMRTLEIRIVGRGQGRLGLGESGVDRRCEFILTAGRSAHPLPHDPRAGGLLSHRRTRNRWRSRPR